MREWEDPVHESSDIPRGFPAKLFEFLSQLTQKYSRFLQFFIKNNLPKVIGNKSTLIRI